MSNAIAKAAQAAINAQKALDDQIVRTYPKGTRVGVYLKDGQHTPTPAKSKGKVAKDKPGHLLVDIDTARDGSTRKTREVHYNNVESL